jgi:hypothetical protein
MSSQPANQHHTTLRRGIACMAPQTPFEAKK